jgi:hypothetical protein
MQKRLQVLMDEEEYLEIQSAARRQRMTVAEWVRQTLRKSRDGQSGIAEHKLRALSVAARHQYPTADIDIMLKEIEAGQLLQ